MILLVGTVPIREMPLLEGFAEFKGEHIMVDDTNLPFTQGTSAMIAAAALTCEYLRSGPPRAVVAGDIGEGTGSTYNGAANDLYATDPKFIDAANGNFRLNPHSLCVNAGTAVGFLIDYLGLMIRHAPDIGAHENQSNAIF